MLSLLGHSFALKKSSLVHPSSRYSQQIHISEAKRLAMAGIPSAASKEAARNCGMKSCTASGCKNSAFFACMSMESANLEALGDSGIFENLPSEHPEGELGGVPAEKNLIEGELGTLPPSKIATECGAGSCDPKSGCDNKAFFSCMFRLSEPQPRMVHGIPGLGFNY